jgi:hypothetical protein
MNGTVIDRKEMEADAQVRDIEFEVDIRQSSWLAIRIYPSSHTNPIFVSIAGRPIRASRKSAEWCRTAVDVCWEQKRKRIRPSELSAAAVAYEHARRAYEKILSEM